MKFLATVLLFVWTATLFAQPEASSQTPREMLRVMQIDDSVLDQFVDDRPVDQGEQEPLLRLLFRLPTFPQVDLDRWTIALPQSPSHDQFCSEHRFDFFQLQGTVDQIDRRSIIPELVQRLGFSEYFQLTISHGTQRSLVFVRQLPEAWSRAIETGSVIHEPVRVQGLLLKHQPVEGQSTLVFAAPRIHWYPTQASQERGVTEDLVMLANMGVDIATLADIQHRTKMTRQDRESFYQLLAAVRHAELSQFEKLGRQEFDIGRLIREPEAAMGELYALEGLARRAIRIEVTDSDIQERFGIDHYFEVEVFVPMDRSVRFVNEDKEQEPRVFQDYPFVFCVPELPPGMPQGDNIRVQVRATGFFLKLWSYRTEFMSQVRTDDNRPAHQLSPLLLGPTVLPKQFAPPEATRIGLIAAVLFIVSLLVIWLLLWRAGIQDQRRARQLFTKNLPPDTSFENLQEG